MSDVRTLWFLFGLSAVACQLAREYPSSRVLAEARRQLEERGRADQAVREGFGVGNQLDTMQIKAMMRTDSANTTWLKSYVSNWGWPTSAQVGHEAVETAFLIVQHAVHDTAFMRSMLPAIEQARKRGDLDGNAVAMLTDRLEVQAGRPQLYGTQMSFHNGRWLLDPIADSVHVDERRRRVGLPPLHAYLRKADSALRRQ
jgi:uncharacterized protein DUF6624